jgi:transposase
MNLPCVEDPQAVVYIGVDVCAKWLDVAGLDAASAAAKPKVKRLPNTEAGHDKLTALLPAAAHVVVEASGGYEQALWLALLRAGKKVSRVNPARVRYFAKADMKLAKTDAIDAAVLASFGASFKLRSDVLPTDWELELADLVGRREQLVTARAQQEVQMQQLRNSELQRQAKTLIKTFNAQIKHLEQSIQKLLETQEAAKKAQRLRQMQGVGPTVAATLIATLPELGKLDDKRICSLAGLAPHPDDSGPVRGQRHIQGGRMKVRRVLYMAALHCVRYNPILKTFYQRLLIKGKPFKLAITAVMRKLLCVLNKLIACPDFTLAH